MHHHVVSIRLAHYRQHVRICQSARNIIDIGDPRSESRRGGVRIHRVNTECEPFCLERVYPYLAEQLEEGSDGLVALVDCGAATLRINVLDCGATVYSREEMFGTQQLSEEIQRRYGLSAEEALAAQRSGDLPGDYPDEVLAPFRKSLLQQMSRALQFFYSSTTYSHLDCMILAGGIVNAPGLIEEACTHLGMPVIGANPFKHMSISSKLDRRKLDQMAPSLLIATGLALRGVS
jgi:type IV pilus assembly protein PilM